MPLFNPNDITQAAKAYEDEEKYGAKNGITYCNFFVRDIVESLLKQPQKELQGQANDQLLGLLKSSKWQKQNFAQNPRKVFEKAHAEVNKGQLAIVAYRNPSKSMVTLP